MNSWFAYIGDKACKALLWEGLAHCPSGALSGLALRTGKGLSLMKGACSADLLQQRTADTKEDGCLGIAAVTAPEELPVTNDTAAPYVISHYALALDGSFTAAAAQSLLQTLAETADGNLLPAMKKHLAEPLGSAVLLAGKELCLYCRAGLTPLYIAIAEHGFFVTDTPGALPPEAVRFHLLQKGESAKLTRERVTIYDTRLRKIKKPLLATADNIPTAELLLPEDNPIAVSLAVKATVSHFIKDGVLIRERVCPLGRSLQRIARVILTGSGDAYLAAAMAAPRFAALADLPAVATESRELVLSNPLMDKGTLLIAVAPEGRDDAAAKALERAAQLGAVTVAVTAQPCSQLAQTAAHTLLIPPGNTPVNAALALSFLTLYIGNRYEVISDVYCSVAVQLATMLTGKVSAAVKAVPPLQNLSGRFRRADTVITAGIGADTATAETAAAGLRRTLQLPVYAQNLFRLDEEENTLLCRALVLIFLTDNALTPAALPPISRLYHSGAEMVIITTESIAADLPAVLPVVAFPDSIPLFNALICLAGFGKISASAAEAMEAAI